MACPRFERTDDDAGTSLVMSSTLTTDSVAQSFKVWRTEDEGLGPDKDVQYNLFNVSFRMYCVNNEGVGESADFMNVVTEPHEKRFETHVWHGQHSSPYSLMPLGNPESMLASVAVGRGHYPL